jgi:hypothetical protein
MSNTTATAASIRRPNAYGEPDARYVVDIPQPERKTPVRRGDTDDPAKALLVAELCAKHGLLFQYPRGTPRRMVVSGVRRGSVSIMFFRFAGGL